MPIKMFRDRLLRLFSGNNRVKLIAFTGILAIALIFLSEILPSKKSDKQEALPENNSKDYSNGYAEKTEQKLSELISSIKGAGKAKVLLSVEGSEEYIYAEEQSGSRQDNGTELEEKNQSKPILTERSGSKEAVIKKVIAPRFNGALVICEGGGDPSVKERIIRAVSAALDLPASKICVECSI